MGKQGENVTGDRNLDRRIAFWKLVIEGYTGLVCTALLYFLATGKCG